MTERVPKYAIHPGWVASKNDGQSHFINAYRLAGLYHLDNDEYIIWDQFAPQRGFEWKDYIHLYPDYQGRYGRPAI